MDINDFRMVSTVLVAIAFTGVTVWAYSSKQKDAFKESAQLPFSDDSDEWLDKGEKK